LSTTTTATTTTTAATTTATTAATTTATATTTTTTTTATTTAATTTNTTTTTTAAAATTTTTTTTTTSTTTTAAAAVTTTTTTTTTSSSSSFYSFASSSFQVFSQFFLVITLIFYALIFPLLLVYLFCLCRLLILLRVPVAGHILLFRMLHFCLPYHDILIFLVRCLFIRFFLRLYSSALLSFFQITQLQTNVSVFKDPYTPFALPRVRQPEHKPITTPPSSAYPPFCPGVQSVSY
jgi:hypothetical protein